jgi:hypothetical protein
LKALVSDLGVVTAHLLLPDSLTGGLPPVNEGFSGFAAAASNDEGLAHGGLDQEAIRDLLDGIEREPSALHYIHLQLPHVPWSYLPDGRDYGQFEVWREVEGDPEAWPQDGRWIADQGLRAHLLQTGYADALLGRIMRAVHSAGVWDDALVVVVADHGASFIPGSLRRYAERHNIGEIAPMPLFVKRPGQTAGRVDDRAVRTIDVLPTIADQLHVELPFKVDGEPAHAVEQRGGRLEVLRGDEDEPRTFDWNLTLRERDAAVARIQRRFGRGWRGVWRVGPHPSLIGRPVSAFDSAPDRGAGSFDLAHADEYDDVDLRSRFVPALVSGGLEGIDAGAPLAVSVNGRIAAVTRAYESVSTGLRTVAMVPPTSFRQGGNEVGLYAVVERGDRLVLQFLGGTGS